jgi:dynamin 1-like protein
VFSREPKYGLEEKQFHEFNGVKGEIEKRTEKRVGLLKNISDDEILLDIYSPNYPDLQLVDLPGITRTTVDGQDSNTVEKILALNMKYMKDPNTIILAIQDGNHDIANSEALTHALKEGVDPEGKRTVGVLTKLDLLHSAADRERVANVLENKTKRLELGYFGVVSRSQDDFQTNSQQSTREEEKLLAEPSLQKARGLGKLGTDSLRRFITQLLGSRVEMLMPRLHEDSMEELNRVSNFLKDNGRFDDEKLDYDDIIAKYVEESITRIKTSLEGQNMMVDIKELSAGASLNEKIKGGTIEASRMARQTYKVEEFHGKLMTAKRNVHGIRDNFLPQELVLEIGVGLLTECYRKPLKLLLEESYELLKKFIKDILEETLGVYEKFKRLVMETILGEIEKNKQKAEEYLDLQINLHKRFINTEHVEFRKSTKVLKKDGIRYPNNFNLWFQEGIPNEEENNDSDTDSGTSSNPFEVTKNMAGAVGAQKVDLGVGNVRGFVNRLQKKTEDDDVHFNKLPSGVESEAQLHLDLCIEYMEIVDKSIVDQIPKMFILMLVHRSLDFLAGGDGYETSLLRRVQSQCHDEQKKKEVLEKSFAHEQMIKSMKERKNVCEDTIRVIQETMDQLQTMKQGKSKSKA